MKGGLLPWEGAHADGGFAPWTSVRKGSFDLFIRKEGIKTPKFRDLLGEQKPKVVVPQICRLRICVALCLFYTRPGHLFCSADSSDFLGWGFPNLYLTANSYCNSAPGCPQHLKVPRTHQCASPPLYLLHLPPQSPTAPPISPLSLSLPLCLCPCCSLRPRTHSSLSHSLPWLKPRPLYSHNQCLARGRYSANI